MKAMFMCAAIVFALFCLAGCAMTLIEGESVTVGEKVVVITMPPSE